MDVAVHACNPSIERLREENCEFQASLDYNTKTLSEETNIKAKTKDSN
jgi:hypothetical protein